ncbi:MAG TPA: phosphotransferase, partial [Micromonosporaceae bacterium]|nr:phosphotransferase [Micromonosporaceae bacterium]
ELAARGRSLTGPIEQVKDRPWSFVAKVPTGDGLLWFKENRAGTVYEAGLMQALYDWAPDRILPPVAIDAKRGWSLLPDGGQTMREAGNTDWEKLLSSFAVLQRDLAPKTKEMLSLGVPDLRPLRLAELAETLPVPAEASVLLKEQCAELAQSPVPASIQHDDLHDANVFADGRFFDWGDASVAHPFGVLLVALRVANDKGLDPPRLRDAYLEPWSDLAPRTQLLREVELAMQVTKVSRALSWQRALTDATPEQVAELEDPVSGWLGELLDDSPY